MEQCWMIDVSFNDGTEKKHFCLSEPNASQKLSLYAGDNQVSAEVLLYVDEDELVIERVGNAAVSVKRGIRERNLSLSHPMRILPKDQIRIGSCEYHIENIHRQDISFRKASPFTSFANKAIFAGAAAVMLASVPACASKEPLKDSSTPNVEQKTVTANDNSNADSESLPESAPVAQNKDSSTPNVEQKTVTANDNSNADSESLPESAPVAQNNEVKPDIANDKAKCDKVKVMCLKNSRYEQCENQPWKLVETCKSPSLCEVNYDQNDVAISTFCDNAEPCQDDTYACFGGALKCEKHHDIGCYRDDQMYKCQDHQWVKLKDCPSDKMCQLQSDNKKADCVEYPRVMGKPAYYNECEYDQEKCESNTIMNCDMGKWHYNKVCPEHETCQVSDNGKPSCVPVNEK